VFYFFSFLKGGRKILKLIILNLTEEFGKWQAYLQTLVVALACRGLRMGLTCVVGIICNKTVYILKAEVNILVAVACFLVVGEKSPGAVGYIHGAGEKSLGTVGHILRAYEKTFGAVSHIHSAAKKSLRAVGYILKEVAYILFWCQGPLKEKGSILSCFTKPLGCFINYLGFDFKTNLERPPVAKA